MPPPDRIDMRILGLVQDNADYMLRICTRDLHSFSAFLQELAATHLVASTRSSIEAAPGRHTTGGGRAL